jgi:TonB family protein
MERFSFAVGIGFLFPTRVAPKREEVMLDQLVVSSGQRREGRKFRALFLGTATLVMSGCFAVFAWSIMAMEVNLSDDGLELSTMVAPVSIPAAEPPKPEPQQAQPKQPNVKSELPTRQVNMLRPDEVRDIPDQVSTAANTQKAHPNTAFIPGRVDSDPPQGGSGTGIDRSGGGGTGIDNSSNTAADGEEKNTPPQLPAKKPVEEKKIVPPILHSSVINGKATSLPVPAYPQTAVAVGAAGEVSVKVLLDENGNVISAQVVSGHPLLRQSALQAARIAKFSPTVLNGQRVKVDGVIVYKFSRT